MVLSVNLNLIGAKYSLDTLGWGGQAEQCFSLLIGHFKKVYVMTKIVSNRDICFV